MSVCKTLKREALKMTTAQFFFFWKLVYMFAVLQFLIVVENLILFWIKDVLSTADVRYNKDVDAHC